MLSIDRRAARAALTIGLVALAVYLVYAVRQTLFAFIVAIFLAYMIVPLVHAIEERSLHRFTRGGLTGLVFAVLIAALVGIAAALGPAISDQAERFAAWVPQLANDRSFIDRLPLPEWLAPLRGRIAGFLHEQADSSGALAAPFARSVGAKLWSLTGGLLFVVLIPILAFLFVKEAPAMRARYLQWASGRRDAEIWRRLADDFDRLLGRYIRALLALAFAAAAAYSIVLGIAGVPYALLLAVGAGLLEFIPVVGPLTAASTILLVAGVSGYDHLAALVGFLVVYRIFQDYVLNPYLMSGSVSLPPLLTLFALLAGEELAGVPGLFLSVPVLAAARILATRLEQMSPAPDGAEADGARLRPPGDDARGGGWF